jgi:hypothetical protein
MIVKNILDHVHYVVNKIITTFNYFKFFINNKKLVFEKIFDIIIKFGFCDKFSNYKFNTKKWCKIYVF